MRFLKPVIWVVVILALLLGGYAAAGHWLAPWWLRTKLPQLVADSTGQRLTIGAAVVRPFALSVELTDVSLTEPDGTPLVAVKRLFADAALRSILLPGVHLTRLVVEEPAVNLVVRPDRSLNLVTALAPKAPVDPVPGDDEEPVRIVIDDFDLARGVIDVADLSRPKPLRERFAPLTFGLEDFSTTAGGQGAFRLRASFATGSRLGLVGRFKLRPFDLSGGVALLGLPAARAWEIAGADARFAPPGGTLAVQTGYRVSATAEGTLIRLDALSAEAGGLALRGAGADRDWITVATARASDGSLDLAARRARIGALDIEGLTVDAWRESSGGLNLAAVAAAPATPPAPDSTERPEASDWNIEVPRIRIAGARVAFEDRVPSAPARFVLEPVEIGIDGFATQAERVDVSLRTGINGEGALQVSGAWRPAEERGEFELDLKSLALTALQPYLDDRTDVVLRSGSLAARGQATANLAVGAAPALSFDGQVSVSRLRAIDRPLREDFVKFGSLQATGISWRTAPESLRVRDVLASQAFVRLVLGPDGRTNISNVLEPDRLKSPEVRAAQARLAESEAALEASQSKSRQQRLSRRERRALEARIAGERAEQRAAEEAASAAAGPGMPVRIDRIRIVDSSANFADLTLRPSFQTGIEQLAGSITGLSSAPDSRAEVSLDGKVDRYAPVEIRGEVNYLAENPITDIRAAFSNIELPTFTPYSGKFMGYQIEKGKLNANLHYVIVDQKLDAKHRFVLDQFELGDRVESTDAVTLPVKLAVALLKDRDGVIDLDLPVTGTLDDPQFRIGPIVWKILVNLLTKIVTAPFALIGSLFGAGEEVRYVDFAFGSGELGAETRDRLAKIGQALADRPQLKLDVPYVVDPMRDAEVMAEQRFTAQLVAAAGEGAAFDAAALRALRETDPSRYLRVLDQAWEEATGEKRAARPERADDEDKATWTLRSVEAAESALRERIAVSDADLQTLGRARADAIRAAVIEPSGIDPARVFVTTGTAATGAANGVRIELRLE
jgi:hypothetical protein